MKISFGGVRHRARLDGPSWSSLTGTLPGHDVRVQLPMFADAGVRDVIGGSYERRHATR